MFLGQGENIDIKSSGESIDAPEFRWYSAGPNRWDYSRGGYTDEANYANLKCNEGFRTYDRTYDRYCDMGGFIQLISSENTKVGCGIQFDLQQEQDKRDTSSQRNFVVCRYSPYEIDVDTDFRDWIHCPLDGTGYGC